MDQMAIIVIGNPIDGLSFVGPFPSTMEAIEFANTDPHMHDHEWWVAPLEGPGDV